MPRKTASATHVEAMRFEIETGSGHVVGSDDGESDRAPRPTELILAALAACTGMDVVSILRKKRQAVTSYVIRVEAMQREAHPQVFTRIEVVHELEGPSLEIEAVRRSIELSATRYCPVNAMLAAGVVEIHHSYDVRAGGAIHEGAVVTTGPGRVIDE